MTEQDKAQHDKTKTQVGAAAARARGLGGALAAGAARARANRAGDGAAPGTSGTSALVTTAIVVALLVGTLAMMLTFAK